VRVSQSVNGVTTRYVVDRDNLTGYTQVLEERDGSGGVTKSYVIGLDVIGQAARTGAGTLPDWEQRYLLYDGHGSARALLNAAGAVVAGQQFA
jgi:hypothetical protein